MSPTDAAPQTQQGELLVARASSCSMTRFSPFRLGAVPTKLASAIGRECGNEPRSSLKGNHRGWLIRVVPAFPAEQG